jgi:hypothetical protein
MAPFIVQLAYSQCLRKERERFPVNDGRKAVLTESVGRCHETDVIALRRGLFYETDVTARRCDS